MSKDKDWKAYEVVGSAECLAAKVAATFPKEFAEVVARWNPGDIDKIIDALEKGRDKRK